MKHFIFTFLLFTFSFTSFSQGETSSMDAAPIKVEATSTVMVKLRNNSFRSYLLTIPNIITISSVVIGTSSFCMTPGQEMFFDHEGKQYLLLTAQKEDKVQHYNLHRLIKKRKKELGLK